MTIRIISNPYTREIRFLIYKEQSQQWEDIKDGNVNSRLREEESGRNFLPFRIKEIIDTIIAEYYITNGEKLKILFEGTQDEYAEVENVCKEEDVKDKITLTRSQTILENARIIFEPTKEIFANVQPIIENIIKDDQNVCKDLNKVSDALKDIIPICVFGNYSSGKSTFINALIGGEVLPSGGDPVTAKVYKIERSKYPDNARVRFSYKDEEFEILFEGTDYRLLKGNVENELIQDIFNAIKESKTEDMNAFVSIALEFINGYEKKNKDDIVISNVIELEIPFSKSGILGQSYNNFVIFDTPGSNSESNIEHSKVLAEALEGFSNGIPVWISTYESIDSTDNASLCEKILDIKALDKRFTMIILNKADGSDLDEGGFPRKRSKKSLNTAPLRKCMQAVFTLFLPLWDLEQRMMAFLLTSIIAKYIALSRKCIVTLKTRTMRHYIHTTLCRIKSKKAWKSILPNAPISYTQTAVCIALSRKWKTLQANTLHITSVRWYICS